MVVGKAGLACHFDYLPAVADVVVVFIYDGAGIGDSGVGSYFDYGFVPVGQE